MSEYSRRRLLSVGCAISASLAAGCLGRDDPDDAATNDPGAPQNETTGPGSQNASAGDGPGADGPADDESGDDAEESEPSFDGPEVAWFREGYLRTSSGPPGLLPPEPLHSETLYVHEQVHDDIHDPGGLVALDATTGARRWRHDSTSSLSSYTDPAADEHGLYVGYGDDSLGNPGGALHALDRDGAVRWTVDTTSVYHRPLVRDGTVFVASDSVTVSAFDAETGAERWATPLEAEQTTQTIPTILGVADGAVVGTVFDGTVRGFDPETGDERWRYDAGDTVRDARLDDDRVFVSTGDQIVRLADGTERWSVGVEYVDTYGPVSGFLLFESDGTLVAIDVDDGSRRWQTDLGEHPEVLVHDGTIYAGASGLTALAPDGTERWTAPLDGSDLEALAASGESVYAATDERVHRLGPDGEGTATDFAGDVRTLVADDERVYVDASEGVVALELSDGDATAGGAATGDASGSA